MKLLFKIAFIILSFFIVLIFVMKLGFNVTLDEVSLYIESIKSEHPLLISLTLCLFFIVDLFFSIPTIALISLAGNLLGFFWGSLTCIVGIFLLGSLGYFLGNRLGPRFISQISKDRKEIDEMKRIFQNNGRFCLLISRSVPMLPELSSCLAGMGEMKYSTFLKWYMAGAIPFILLISYSGSISRADNLSPLIFTLFFVYFSYGIFAFAYRRKNKKLSQSL